MSDEVSNLITEFSASTGISKTPLLIMSFLHYAGTVLKTVQDGADVDSRLAKAFLAEVRGLGCPAPAEGASPAPEPLPAQNEQSRRGQFRVVKPEDVKREELVEPVVEPEKTAIVHQETVPAEPVEPPPSPVPPAFLPARDKPEPPPPEPAKPEPVQEPPEAKPVAAEPQVTPEPEKPSVGKTEATWGGVTLDPGDMAGETREYSDEELAQAFEDDMKRPAQPQPKAPPPSQRRSRREGVMHDEVEQSYAERPWGAPIAPPQQDSHAVAGTNPETGEKSAIDFG